jgi:hypothetical protein
MDKITSPRWDKTGIAHERSMRIMATIRKEISDDGQVGRTEKNEFFSER